MDADLEMINDPDYGLIQRGVLRRNEVKKAADLARETNYERLREKRRERYFRWIMVAAAVLAPCVALYGIWYFAIEPLVHYHSLSVACAAQTKSACYDLMRY